MSPSTESPHQSSEYLQSEGPADLDTQRVETQRPILGGRVFDPRFSNIENLDGDYRTPDQRQEAMQLNQKRFQAQSRTLGEEHSHIIHSIIKLTSSYLKRRQYQEAMQLYHEALEAQRRILSEEHLDTIQTMTNLAKCYRRLRRFNGVMQLNQQALTRA